MPYAAQLSLQEAMGPTMEEVVFLHDHVLLLTCLMTLVILMFTITATSTTLTHNDPSEEVEQLEAAWTAAPIMILILTALPSVRSLYLMEEVFDPYLTIKATGHQWYWNYEYSDETHISFDSYMLQTQDLKKGSPRLLEVDHRMVMPAGLQTRIVVTAEDVLHSWAIPSLGVKVDAVPGRLNQVPLATSRTGIFFGQCSEICGANHSFMPIAVEATPLFHFEQWLSSEQ
uniref:Cytochrome c oxidase subunit 2 n=1 Tax=Vipera berus TaxID=31155 RepID=A0A343SWC8_VIPBE|nr:cytochrome c oxidase subunit II [Vipera berus]YP_010263858.1 cytochrome c oxidase subunit II [Echis carinatus]YP_010263871.1 cytochrome c oxidase subunit II [Echis coloratus]YP_010384460.1 cytochrome c oxidase subunit II [Echis omanensis]AUT77194.1 cytochrome c oxidase subunit II [Vipera berus]QHI42772.1 cytochrome c oxidase subunit II [Vipera berus]QHI42823.1 cytochrome c oxidase subunit II [Vipera berus]UGW52619.1 cytochrome c oxidase subunit II [Echis carinatus]UGW52632.1 cytochrome c